MNKYKRLVSNTMIFAAGTFTSKVLVLLLMPLYTSILSREQYGVADIITQTANLLIPVACIGICDGIFRFAIDSADRKKLFSTALCAILAVSLCFLALSPLLSFVKLISNYVWLICAYVICANLHSVCAQYVRARGQTVAFAIQGILNTVLTIVYNILLLVVFDMGVVGYVLSVVLADLTVSVVLFISAKLYRDFSFVLFDRGVLRELLKFSLPYIPTTMLWLITSVSDRFIVTAYCGEAENGLYSVAYKIPTLLTIACGVFNEAWQLSAVGDNADDRPSFFSTVYKNYMSLMVVGASFLMLLTKFFTELLLADAYYVSWRFVPILLLATMFSALVSFMGSVYFLEKKSISSMLTALSGAVVNIILNFAMIPDHGAMGAAVATMISYMTVYAIRVVDTKKYVKFNTHNLSLTLNTLLLLAQAIIFCSGIRYSEYVCLIIFCVIGIINLKGILATILKISRKFFKKDRKI